MSRKDHQDAAFAFTPRNDVQREVWDLWPDPASDIYFLLGVAGSGKSQLAVALALRDVLVLKRRKKVLLTRPAVEASGRTGKGLGFLPGIMEEKLAPYLRPLLKLIPKVAFRPPPDTIEIVPLEYLRGETFEDCIAILDEAQNASREQLKMFLTRLGKNSRIILAGDPQQSDIASPELHHVAIALEGVPGIEIFDFLEDDCVRHPLVREVLRRL